MRRRLPLLRTVSLLTAAFAIAAVSLLVFVRVPRMATAPGQLAGGETPTRFEGVVERTDFPSLRSGQTATIRLDSYPWMQKGTLSGRVMALGESSLPGGGYAVTLSVDPNSAPGPLLDGLRGEARIATGETESLGRLLFSRMAKDSR